MTSAPRFARRHVRRLRAAVSLAAATAHAAPEAVSLQPHWHAGDKAVYRVAEKAGGLGSESAQDARRWILEVVEAAPDGYLARWSPDGSPQESDAEGLQLRLDASAHPIELLNWKTLADAADKGISDTVKRHESRMSPEFRADLLARMHARHDTGPAALRSFGVLVSRLSAVLGRDYVLGRAVDAPVELSGMGGPRIAATGTWTLERLEHGRARVAWHAAHVLSAQETRLALATMRAAAGLPAASSVPAHLPSCSVAETMTVDVDVATGWVLDLERVDTTSVEGRAPEVHALSMQRE